MIKAVKINGKKLSLMLVLIGLIFILIGFEKNLSGRLDFASLIYDNISELKQYSITKKYVYKLPQNWKTQEYSFESKEILYHNQFVSNDDTIHGIVQEWSLKTDLKKFLVDSQNSPFRKNIIKDYKIKEIKINQNKAYELTYSLIDESSNMYKSIEYFIPEDNGFIRFAFFINNDNFTENQLNIFNTIVKTLKHT